MSDSVRVIKKYANRRLYDTCDSCYVTLEDIRSMVLRGEQFRITGVEGEDITAQILLNILLSGGALEEAFFSEHNLRSMIQFMHGPIRGTVSAFFEQCLPLFTETQNNLRARFGPSLQSDDLSGFAQVQSKFVRQMVEQYICRSLENYVEIQKRFETMVKANPFSPFGEAFPMLAPDASRKKDEEQ